MTTPTLRELFRPREVADFPGPLARRAWLVAEGLRAAWERTSRDAVETGRVGELHAARDNYHALLQGHLRFLREYLALAELHRRTLGSKAVWVEALTRAEREFRSLYDELFPRWQSLNDLRELLDEKFSAADDTPRPLITRPAAS